MDLFLNNTMLNNMSQEVSYLQKKQNVIVSNIANIDTPSYKALKVIKTNINKDKNNFKLNVTHNKHFYSMEDNEKKHIKTIKKNNYIFDNTGNDVNLDEEKIESSVNAMKINASINAFKKYTTGKKILIDNISKY
ncbi:hypothetical protein HOK00_00505 [bacterium]|nr:hypothetical protein [bacterium]